MQPYLNFNGRCEEAVEFYKTALGAKVTMLMRFKDNPEPQPSGAIPGSENKVMHVSLLIGDSTVMASDCNCQGEAKFQGISLSLSLPNDAEAEKRFNALAEGGKICVPLAKTFFSSKFGVVNDRFGITWMVIVQPH